MLWPCLLSFETQVLLLLLQKLRDTIDFEFLFPSMLNQQCHKDNCDAVIQLLY